MKTRRQMMIKRERQRKLHEAKLRKSKNRGYFNIRYVSIYNMMYSTDGGLSPINTSANTVSPEVPMKKKFTVEKTTPVNKNSQSTILKERADKLYKTGDYESALSQYTEFIALNPLSEIGYGNRSACLMMMNRYADALIDAKRSIEINPVSIKCLTRVIKCSIIIGHLDEAQRALMNLEKIAPQHELLASTRSNIDKINEFMMVAEEAFADKQYYHALLNLDNVLTISTHGNSYKIKKAECLAHLRRFTEAENIIYELRDDESLNLDSKYVLALCVYQKDIEKAVNCFEVILRLAPDHTKTRDIYMAAVNLLMLKAKGDEAHSRGSYLDAYKFYTQALTIDPQHEEMVKLLHYKRACTSFQLNLVVVAINEVSQCLIMDPNYIEALVQRGRWYLHLEQYEFAIEDFTKASKVNSECEKLLILAQQMATNARPSDNYVILGVKQNATWTEIKKAYTVKTKKHDPDHHANLFKEITRAYRELQQERLEDID